MKTRKLFGHPAFLFALSVVFFALANPNALLADGFSFFAWICFVPLFLFIRKIPLKFALSGGFLYGAASFFCLCHWLSSFGLVSILFVLALYGFFYALLFLLLKLIDLKFPRLSFVLFPFVLVLFEFLRAKGFLGFSYGIIGYSQWKNPIALRMSSVTGVYGVSLLIYIVNRLFSGVLSHESASVKKICVLACVCLLLCAVPSFFADIKKNPVGNVKVSLVQNFSSDESSDFEDFARDFEMYRNLSESAIAAEPDIELVVWPETSIVPDVFHHFSERKDLRRTEFSDGVFEFFENTRKNFLVGTNHRENKDGKTSFHNSAMYLNFREQEKSENSSEIRPAAARVSFYDKTHLVPFTELLPEFLKHEPFSRIARTFPSDDFTEGSSLKVFDLKDSKFGVMICFEDSFPEIASELKGMGADFLVNITDDSWAKSRAAQKIHLAMSVFRAAENRIPVVRSTVSGETCFIDRNGKVYKSLPSFEDNFLTGQVEIIR